MAWYRMHDVMHRTRPSHPSIVALVLQATNAGVRMPGYEGILVTKPLADLY